MVPFDSDEDDQKMAESEHEEEVQEQKEDEEVKKKGRSEEKEVAWNFQTNLHRSPNEHRGKMPKPKGSNTNSEKVVSWRACLSTNDV